MGLRRPRRSVTVLVVVPLVLVLVAAGTAWWLSRPRPVGLDAPRVGAATDRACARLVAALPSRLSGARSVAVDEPGRGAAWGDPAVVLVCGVGPGEGFDRFSACQDVNGLGWYIPARQFRDADADLVATTIGRSPRVEVRVPGRVRPAVDLLPALRDSVLGHTRQVGACR